MSLALLTHEQGLRSEDLENARTKFNERIAALQKRRSEIEGIIASVHTPHRHLLTSAQLSRAHDQKVAAVDVLREEYVIRNELNELYFPLLRDARSEATLRAFDELEKITNEIEAGLVKLGFAKGHIAGTNVPGITNEMTGRHPRVFEARNRHVNAQSLSSFSPEPGANDEAMKALGEQIDKAITALTRT